MNTVELLLVNLSARGIRLVPDGGKLIAEPASKLTDADRQAIRAHKAELLAHIQLAPRGQPQFCARCLRVLTATPEQLLAHIEQAARTLSTMNLSWPADEFRERMARELEPGDEIIMLAVGRVTVQRRRGEVVTIYQRES